MATLPTTGWAEVRVTEVLRQGQTQSPYTGQRKVYDWAVAPRYLLSLKTRAFKEGDSDAETWAAFFDSLNGMVETFTMDISRYVPGRSGLASVTFRSTGKDSGPFGFGKQRVFVFELEALSE
jgi:hypothetical protein